MTLNRQYHNEYRFITDDEELQKQLIKEGIEVAYYTTISDPSLSKLRKLIKKLMKD